MDCCSFFLTSCLSPLFIFSLSLLRPPHSPLPPHPTRLRLITATDGISSSPCGAHGSHGPRPLCITRACDSALCAREKWQCDCDSVLLGRRGKQRMFTRFFHLRRLSQFIFPPFFVSPLTRTARIHIDSHHLSPLTLSFLHSISRSLFFSHSPIRTFSHQLTQFPTLYHRPSRASSSLCRALASLGAHIIASAPITHV